MEQITYDTIRAAIQSMKEMEAPHKTQEDLLLSQALYDQLLETAKSVSGFNADGISTFEGIVVRVDPELTGNQYRWDDSKAKEQKFKRLSELKDEMTPWYCQENMDMWRWMRNFYKRN